MTALIDRGEPILTTTIYTSAVFPDGLGNTHLMLCYRTPDYNQPATLVDINITAKTHRVIQGPSGYGWSVASGVHPTSDLVYLVFDTPQHLTEYNPITGDLTVITSPAQRQFYRLGIAPDGTLWWGGVYYSLFSHYNPGTGVYTEHGHLEANWESMSAGRYGYYTQPDPSDNDFIYFTIAYVPWTLAVYQRSLDTVTLYWQDQNDLGGGFALNPGLTTVYYQRVLAGGGTQWYSLISGVVTLLGGPPAVASVPIAYEWDVDSTQWTARYGFLFDLDDALPITGDTGVVRIKPAGSPDWDVYNISGIGTDAAQLFKAAQLSSDKLILVPREYYPLVIHAPSTHLTTIQGWTGSSVYSLLVLAEDDVFIGTYFKSTYRWNPTLPWTLTASVTNPTSPVYNPYKIIDGGGSSHEYLVELNGLVWIVSRYVRTAYGSEIICLNPDDLSHLHYRTEWGLENYDPCGACACSGFLIYAASHIDGVSDGKVFVIDPFTRTLRDTWTPLPGQTDTGAIIGVSDTDIVGVSFTHAYRLNVRTGEVVWTKTFVGTAWYGATYTFQRILELGWDDTLRFPYQEGLTHQLSSMSIEDGTITATVAAPTAPVNMVWFDEDLYALGESHLYQLDLPAFPLVPTYVNIASVMAVDPRSAVVHIDNYNDNIIDERNSTVYETKSIITVTEGQGVQEIMTTFRKDPGETLDFSINWKPSRKPKLQTGETIISSTWTVPAGIVKVSDSFTDTVTTIWISGGTLGEEYNVTDTVVTNMGRTLVRTFPLIIGRQML